MAEPFSIERRKIMRMLGAKVIVTPKAGKGTGMVAKAAELCAEHGWFLCHQFETDDNWKFHEATTGAEILAAFQVGARRGSHVAAMVSPVLCFRGPWVPRRWSRRRPYVNTSHGAC
jgi:cysteine synthase